MRTQCWQHSLLAPPNPLLSLAIPSQPLPCTLFPSSPQGGPGPYFPLFPFFSSLGTQTQEWDLEARWLMPFQFSPFLDRARSWLVLVLASQLHIQLCVVSLVTYVPDTGPGFCPGGHSYSQSAGPASVCSLALQPLLFLFFIFHLLAGPYQCCSSAVPSSVLRRDH